jgi:hypothetical protein
MALGMTAQACSSSSAGAEAATGSDAGQRSKDDGGRAPADARNDSSTGRDSEGRTPSDGGRDSSTRSDSSTHASNDGGSDSSTGSSSGSGVGGVVACVGTQGSGEGYTCSLWSSSAPGYTCPSGASPSQPVMQRDGGALEAAATLCASYGADGWCGAGGTPALGDGGAGCCVALETEAGLTTATCYGCASPSAAESSCTGGGQSWMTLPP